MLTNFNERFVIAHEYGHTLQDQMDVVHPPDQPWDEEFACDGFALQVSIDSAAAGYQGGQ